MFLLSLPKINYNDKYLIGIKRIVGMLNKLGCIIGLNNMFRHCDRVENILITI